MVRLALVVSMIGLMGCTGIYDGGTGGGGGGGDDDGPAPGEPDAAPGPGEPDAAPVIPASFTLALDGSGGADLVLGETRSFTVTLTSEHGFAGPVTLAAAGVPAGWQTGFAPSDTITLADGETATATFDVTIPTDAEAGPAGITIIGTAGPTLAEQAPLALAVAPELVMHIPLNALGDPGAAFGGTVNVRYFAPGTKVTWVNDDLVAHRIHADNVNGMNHEDDDMAPQGGSYSVVITQPGTYGYNCHIHPQMTGVLVITN